MAKSGHSEPAAYRNIGFTGIETFRGEPCITVADITPNYCGDYSLGPMQTMATTTRWVIQSHGLGLDRFGVMTSIRV